MEDLTVTRPFSEEDYNELLQQAVAVIETSRLRIAKQLNTIQLTHFRHQTTCSMYRKMYFIECLLIRLQLENEKR